MAKKKESEDGNYKVGAQVKAKLHDGRKVDATIRAVFQQNDEIKLNIDFGHQEIATVALWLVVG